MEEAAPRGQFFSGGLKIPARVLKIPPSYVPTLESLMLSLARCATQSAGWLCAFAFCQTAVGPQGAPWVSLHSLLLLILVVKICLFFTIDNFWREWRLKLIFPSVNLIV